MRIAITGARGFVGSAVCRDLEATGHTVVRFVRPGGASGADTIHWDPAAGILDRPRLEDLDAVVHLAGESIASGRWSAARKTRILDSRVRGTQLLATALAALARPPSAFVCASAMGYYGDRGDEILREDSPPGTGFLADTCRAWEAAAEPARARGIRVVSLRIGLVLDATAGALAKMLSLFRLGLGAPLGSGQQYTSWITLADLVGAVRFAIEQPLAGALNAVAPCAVTNRVFTRALNAVLGRPTPPAVPGFVLRLAMGEMAGALLLASLRIEPARLVAAGFRFRYPELEPALRELLRH